jgi:hypothetical protein
VPVDVFADLKDSDSNVNGTLCQPSLRPAVAESGSVLITEV